MTDLVKFDDSFGVRFSVSVDTEEEFDWDEKFSRHEHDVRAATALVEGQRFFESAGVCPIYYVDLPIAQSASAVAAIGAGVDAGTAEVGVHLHPWVTPPFVERVNRHNSYVGNLDAEIEQLKIRSITAAVESAFGVRPQAYRAGRYGIGPNSYAILVGEGYKCDSSVRPLFDYSADGGPDFTNAINQPYWTDAERRLLELPLSTYFVGWAGRLRKTLFKASATNNFVRSLISRLDMSTRVALTPEGTPLPYAIRMIDVALDEGVRVLNMSFHSPSLAVGHTPYVQSDADLRAFYGWFDGVFNHCAKRGVNPASMAQILAASDAARAR